jgi:hypothetical protein
MQLQTSEIRQPHERGRIARHHLLRRAPRRKTQLHHFDPARPAPGCALLIEVLAFNAVRVSHQHSGPAAGAPQRAFGDSHVVPGEIELRMPRLREQHLVRVRDGDLAPGDVEDFSFAVPAHHA